MKFSPLIVIAASTLVLAAESPKTCDTKCKARSGADFKLTASDDNEHLSDLSKLFKDKLVPVSTVFDDGNHNMSLVSTGRLAWEEEPDFDDMNTNKWIPQGITTTADAYDIGTYEGKDGWLVSWYNTEGAGVRISFINKITNKYRHTYLIEPTASDNFKAINVHAGGIMLYGATLWVVDTSHGIRVFDMNNIWEVESGDGVGKKDGGGYSAAGYKYVIPQIRMYSWTADWEFHFSYISLDRTSTPDSILVGEFADDDSVPMRMVKWDVDYRNRKLFVDGKIASGSWAYCVDIERVQGAVQVDDKIFISRSNPDRARGDMFGWIPGNYASPNYALLPWGPEDLTYDKRDNVIYTVTEHAGERYIIFIEADKVTFDDDGPEASC